MIPNFKVYVPTLDEDILIRATIGALLEVFPPEQIEVIDLGSKDKTLHRIPKNVKVTSVTLPDKEPGAFFTALKEEYSKKQDWVMWVDGDEVYPTSSLLNIVKWLEAPDKTALRMYWRVIKEEEGKLYVSNEVLPAGPKLHNSNYRYFNRAWPKENLLKETGKKSSVLSQVEGPKDEFNGIWSWHGVLLQRSNNVERTARRKKRQAKVPSYNKLLTWKGVSELPWKKSYISNFEPTRVVLNPYGA